MIRDGFVFVDEFIPGIKWDAKYAGSDNFMGRPAEGYLVNRAVISLEAARALKEAQKMAEDIGLCLFVFDAYRPARAVKDFCTWAIDASDTLRKRVHYPNIDKSALIPEGYIAARSGHSRGSVVDLTLCDKEGNRLDMGTIFDFMDPLSHHDCPNITCEQTRNRALLRKIMLSCGFEDYDCEWWHYRLKDEPYPDTYFDFVIE